MKTTQQICAENGLAHMQETARLFRKIQLDALEYAAELCIQNAKSGNPEGWTDSVSRECAAIIKSQMRRAAMPNV